jgi:hypothetical protein
VQHRLLSHSLGRDRFPGSCIYNENREIFAGA